MTTVDVDVRPVAGHLSAQVIEQIAIQAPHSSEAMLRRRAAQGRLSDATRLDWQVRDYSTRQAPSEILATHVEFTAGPQLFMNFAEFMENAGVIEKTLVAAFEASSHVTT